MICSLEEIKENNEKCVLFDCLGFRRKEKKIYNQNKIKKTQSHILFIVYEAGSKKMHQHKVKKVYLFSSLEMKEK